MDHFVIDTHCLPQRTGRARGSDGASYSRHAQRLYSKFIKARYDAAGMSPEMEAWWAEADQLSPRASATKTVRKRIRERARYECYQSGSIANGMIEALVNAVIAYGPTLQANVRLPNGDSDQATNRLIEEEFGKWSKEAGLSKMLRRMFRAKIVDGEVYAVKGFNPRMASPVKLGIRDHEADFFTNPFVEDFRDEREDDGHFYDTYGNVIRYRRLNNHPGDDRLFDPMAFTDIRSDMVIHWFNDARPGQRRGVSEFAASLKPLAQLRRYQMAVQAAADLAASHAGVMFSTASAFSESPDEPDEDDSFLNVPIPRGSLVTLPAGWDMKQFRPEQPSTQYVDFVEERISAAARPLQMPLNIAIGSSRNHNFASARLDRMQFRAANEPRRRDCDDTVMDTVFSWWLFEANRVPEYLPPLPDEIPHSWQWPVDDPIDPVTQARADEIYFNLGWLTDERFCKERGLDVDELHAQWERQTLARNDAGENFPQPGIAMNESIMDEQEQPEGAQ